MNSKLVSIQLVSFKIVTMTKADALVLKAHLESEFPDEVPGAEKWGGDDLLHLNDPKLPQILGAFGDAARLKQLQSLNTIIQASWNSEKPRQNPKTVVTGPRDLLKQLQKNDDSGSTFTIAGTADFRSSDVHLLRSNCKMHLTKVRHFGTGELKHIGWFGLNFHMVFAVMFYLLYNPFLVILKMIGGFSSWVSPGGTSSFSSELKSLMFSKFLQGAMDNKALNISHFYVVLVVLVSGLVMIFFDHHVQAQTYMPVTSASRLNFIRFVFIVIFMVLSYYQGGGEIVNMYSIMAVALLCFQKKSAPIADHVESNSFAAGFRVRSAAAVLKLHLAFHQAGSEHFNRDAVLRSVKDVTNYEEWESLRLENLKPGNAFAALDDWEIPARDEAVKRALALPVDWFQINSSSVLSYVMLAMFVNNNFRFSGAMIFAFFATALLVWVLNLMCRTKCWLREHDNIEDEYAAYTPLGRRALNFLPFMTSRTVRGNVGKYLRISRKLKRE